MLHVEKWASVPVGAEGVFLVGLNMECNVGRVWKNCIALCCRF